LECADCGGALDSQVERTLALIQSGAALLAAALQVFLYS
jgi:hypothetical protein